MSDSGNHRLADDMRKHRDAIMWGAKTAKQHLPVDFYEDNEHFHKGCQREHADARKKGEAMNTAADPISVALHKKLLQWALDESDVFVWHWTQSQWNLMAWSANIDPLKLHNFKLGTDAVMIEFDESKSDEQAQRLAQKNVHAHPFDFRLCHFTGLGIHVALWKETMKGTAERLFLSSDAKEGTASKAYVEQLQSVVGRHQEELETHMSPSRFNPHGLQKGAATCATSGTANAPSVPAIARRGEWSAGTVLDCCWHCSQTEDQHLGRVLTGLDPASSNFDCLPPHLNLDNPMANSHVERAMKITCGEEFLDEHPDFTRISLRCLAAIVHHKDSLTAQMHKVSGHDFNNITILHKHALLGELDKLVTIDPSTVIAVPAGIPPHVQTNRNLTTIIGDVCEVFELQKGTGPIIVESVNKALEDRAVTAGQPTMAALKGLLDEQVVVIKRIQKEGFKAIANAHNILIPDEDAGDSGFDGTNGDGTNGNNQVENKWLIEGAFRFVPPDFQFPSCVLDQGIRCWFKGMQLDDKIIRPF